MKIKKYFAYQRLLYHLDGQQGETRHPHQLENDQTSHLQTEVF